ncbi:SusC/RagA family TonB-linked outer membrane protein [Neolewinella lacunae]|uniref:SusC/RagA family TonB-linked outer membrane protein n=1 Tax=Neolewinella lacunae TaxID=1517758 RepID=A0A923T867_9BACT|nr:SusC/RagA family TonB-linked outer membrane protein [Neolewinella lacunae]MBC6994256.1 SusC/RagA family TonB-linked outer membrane protein [Neolewinella lacunae]MDN3637126.1 SusC/RagA family TonB-linked outer membrane protein [Neolewinella lacunae]
MLFNIKWLKLAVALLLLPSLTFAQKNLTTVTARVLSINAEPVAGASVSTAEGSIVVTTDDSGNFTIKAKPTDILRVASSGFASQQIQVSDVAASPVISLERLPFQLSEEDKVKLPFGSFKKRHIVGGVTTLNIEDILAYDNEQNFNGILTARVPGLFGGGNIRGLGEGVVIVDGIPRPASSLNLQEIDQISVLRGITARALYGSQAERGLIYVTTKRGQPFERRMNITAETGFLSAISFPDYLGSADYMSLFNEALANDGEAPRYTQAQIDATRAGTNPVLNPDQDYFNSTFLSDMNPFHKIIMEASGGNNNARYYLNLGWNRIGSFLNIGEGINEKSNRFNVRGNVDYKLNDWLSFGLDGVAVIQFDRNPRYSGGDFWSLASTVRPDAFPLLIPADQIGENLLPSATLVNGNFVLGGTNEFPDQNVYGELVLNGFRETTDRVVQINSGLDFDLSGITPGLTAKAYLSFDFINSFVVNQTNDYAVYQSFQGTDSLGNPVTNYQRLGNDVRSDDQIINNNDIGFSRRLGTYGVIDYEHRLNGGPNRLKLTALAYRDEFSTRDELQFQKNLHFGLRANYAIADKYIFEAVGTYAGSPRFIEENRWAFSPSLGASWVLSEEKFLAESKVFDYLKLNASWGIINTDQGVEDFYLYRTSFTQGGNFFYNDGVFFNNILNLTSGNEGLGWIKRKELNIGFEAKLGKSLWLETNYFRSQSSDQITRLTQTYPGLLGGDDFTPLENFESYLDSGLELGANWENKVGKFTYSLGVNLVYATPKALIVNESDGLPDYRRRQGQPTDAIFGYVSEGFFANQEDIDNHAVQTFGEVQPGDIKYRDLNNDGIINQDDQEIIGNASARFQYGLNLRLGYGGFTLFVQGLGQTGGDRYFNNPYYWVFGDRKYSTEVLDRWTPETAATATYPRLSSRNNPNNFRNSTQWLYDNGFFNLRRVQLSYSLPQLFNGMQTATIYLRAANLFTIADALEERELNIGTAPQTRTYAAGIIASF